MMTNILNKIKKNVMLHYILLALPIGGVGGGFLASCSEDKIEPWGGDALVWFPQEKIDFTFATHQEVAEGESYMVGIPMRVAAKVSDHDRVVNIEVTRKADDSRTQYEVQTPVVFHAGNISDTVWVKVTNSSHLEKVHDTITVKVLPSADFTPGLPKNLECSLCLFNGLAKPAWWNANTDYYLGKFSQLKMRTYIQVVGNDDAPTDEDGWAGNKFKFVQFILRDYAAKNEIYYPDDDPEAPGQRMTFNSNSY